MEEKLKKIKRLVVSVLMIILLHNYIVDISIILCVLVDGSRKVIVVLFVEDKILGELRSSARSVSGTTMLLQGLWSVFITKDYLKNAIFVKVNVQ